MAMFGMTDEKKNLLIQEIYRRPLIWKISEPKYTDVPARWLAFEEVAQALTDSEISFTSDMVKVAWKNMMDYYNQIRRRHDRAVAAGIQPPESKWQYYHMMHFTKQDKPPVKRKYNWMEPSKIPRKNGETFVSDEYTLDQFALQSTPDLYSALYDKNGAPRALTMANSPNLQSSRSTPRTKESEKARIQAKRAALREANVSATKQLDSPKKGQRTPKKAKEEPLDEDEDDAGMTRRRSQRQQALRKSTSGRLSFKEEDDPQTASGKRERGKKRRLSPSPPPPKGHKRGTNSPIKRAATASPIKRVSLSPRKNINNLLDHPISAVDSSATFARLVATRLCQIKSTSATDYMTACQAIDKTLKTMESSLGIADVAEVIAK